MNTTTSRLDGWPRRLRSRRLLLHALSPADPDPAWLAEAEIAVRGGGESCSLPRPDASPASVGSQAAANDIAYWLRRTGPPQAPPAHDPIGACAARIEADDLVWTWLAVGADWRALGLGGAAVPIVERAAARLGCSQGRVLVPAGNGIGLYFWLRLGYRPSTAPSWPKPIEGTWMQRDLRRRDKKTTAR